MNATVVLWLDVFTTNLSHELQHYKCMLKDLNMLYSFLGEVLGKLLHTLEEICYNCYDSKNILVTDIKKRLSFLLFDFH